MDLRQLQTFVAAADCENFTHAADILKLTQAAVSKQVAALEEDLGVALFDRTGRSVVPTEAGRRLQEYAREILELAVKARLNVGKATGTVSGSIRIASSTVPAECLLPELLASFHRQQPDIQVTVDVSDSLAAARAVLRREAELGIVGELPDSGKFSTLSIASDELLLIVPPDHKLAGQKTVSAERLLDEPFIVRERGSGSRHCVEEALRHIGVEPGRLKIAMEMGSNCAIRSAVARGIGLAFQSNLAIEEAAAEGRLAQVAIRGFRAAREFHAITDANRSPSPALRALLAFFKFAF